MDLRRDHLKRTARAPAKLNLYLEILGRRRDGFHELETLMVPIALADSVTFTPLAPRVDGRSAEILLDIRCCLPVRPPPATDKIPTGRANLVVKALELLRERSGCRWGADVELVKRIPSAAGLGGASSDAAAALCLANRGWQLNWSGERLAALAAEVGSDVPFFVFRRPAVCSGRGERVEPINGMAAWHFVIVKPPAALHTADVYQAHDDLSDAAQEDDPRSRTENPARATSVRPAAAALSSGRRPSGASWLHNRLQAAAAALSPWVARLREVFNALDCWGHQLSGSGSAYFGVCRDAKHARRLAAVLRMRQLGLVYATRSYP
jgi:4-diphosphocytidyl-2-C-methyl-D-erythritol kinase